MLHSLDPRRGWLLTNSLHTQTSGAELHQIKLARSMRVHPSDSLSLQSGKSPLHRSSPAGSSRVGPLLQVPLRDIRAPGHASRRVHKTTFPQPPLTVPTISFKMALTANSVAKLAVVS